jgi:hypothetical protein
MFFPLGILAMRSMYLDEYDVVLISSTNCAKYVRFSDKTIVINYCYTPFRLAWNPESYSEYTSMKGIKKSCFKALINVLRKIDKFYAERTDYFLAMTKETKERVEKLINLEMRLQLLIHQSIT